MKLATLKDGSRDGQLIVVSRDLKTACIAYDIAPTLQRALDDWNFIAPQLQELSQKLNAGKVTGSFDFKSEACMAPLPRAYRSVSAETYPAFAERVLQTELPAGKAAVPVFAEKNASALSGAADDLLLPSEAWGLDFGAEIFVVSGDVPRAVPLASAFETIRLIGMCARWSLRERSAQAGIAAGVADFGASIAPVLITPDELGEHWHSGKVRLPVRISWNGNLIGQPDAGGMLQGFAELVSYLSQSLPVSAGTMIGGGIVADKEAGRGYGCIAEKRAAEQKVNGEANTAYMRHGDLLKIDLLDKAGKSVFGQIDVAVVDAL